MFKFLSAQGFAGVPYLETSDLMKNHPKGVTFSTEKPNVILGPNGAGKSALMKTLALLTLSYYSGESMFDDNYHARGSARGCDDLWTNPSRWGNDWTYLQGVTCESDFAPALFYRPGAYPGDYNDTTHAMMCGYFEEAKAHARLTEKKSSGQKSRAVLEKLMAALQGDFPQKQYGFVNWSEGKKRRDLKEMDRRSFTGPWEYQSEVLKERYLDIPESAIPCLLGDEMEQSLDAKVEAEMWQKIAAVDPTKLQVIVATHSLYPFLHPEKFHVIEAVPGYIAEVQALL